MNENAIQKAVFQHIRTRGVPGLIAFHIPNGGYRRPKEARALLSQGVEPGVSDVILYHDGDLYALELKAGLNKPTPKQLEFLAKVEAAGGNAAWHRGLRAAVHQLERWGLLKGVMA